MAADASNPAKAQLMAPHPGRDRIAKVPLDLTGSRSVVARDELSKVGDGEAPYTVPRHPCRAGEGVAGFAVGEEVGARPIKTNILDRSPGSAGGDPDSRTLPIRESLN